MTTSEVKAIADEFNANSLGHIQVDSPAAYSQWRVSYQFAPGIFLFNWITVEDWKEADTWQDVTLVD